MSVKMSCLFLAALWSPDGKGWPLCSFVCDVFLYFCRFSIWCPVSGVVFDGIDSWSVPSSLLCYECPPRLSPITIESAMFTSIAAIWLATGLYRWSRLSFSGYLSTFAKLRNIRVVGISFPLCAVSVLNNQALSLGRYFTDNQNLYNLIGKAFINSLTQSADSGMPFSTHL